MSFTNGAATNDWAENSSRELVSANKFRRHTPAQVQKSVQVQGTTSKEYSEDDKTASRKW